MVITGTDSTSAGKWHRTLGEAEAEAQHLLKPNRMLYRREMEG